MCFSSTAPESRVLRFKSQRNRVPKRGRVRAEGAGLPERELEKGWGDDWEVVGKLESKKGHGPLRQFAHEQAANEVAHVGWLGGKTDENWRYSRISVKGSATHQSSS